MNPTWPHIDNSAGVGNKSFVILLELVKGVGSNIFKYSFGPVESVNFQCGVTEGPLKSIRIHQFHFVDYRTPLAFEIFLRKAVCVGVYYLLHDDRGLLFQGLGSPGKRGVHHLVVYAIVVFDTVLVEYRRNRVHRLANHVFDKVTRAMLAIRLVKRREIVVNDTQARHFKRIYFLYNHSACFYISSSHSMFDAAALKRSRMNSS